MPPGQAEEAQLTDKSRVQGDTGSCLPEQCSAPSTANGPVVHRQDQEGHPPRRSEDSEVQQG